MRIRTKKIFVQDAATPTVDALSALTAAVFAATVECVGQRKNVAAG